MKLLSQFLLLMFFASVVSAETFTPVVGVSERLDGVDTTDEVEVTIFDGRSYCCQITSNTAGSSDLGFDSISVTSGVLNSAAQRGKINPWLISAPANARRCFIFTESGGGNGIADVKFGISATGTLNGVYLKCTDTTLYGGFNTVVTDFNFIEITNTLTPNTAGDDGTVQVVVKAFKQSGEEILNTTLDPPLAAGQRRDIDIHSVAASDFGPVVITHNGPPGAIRAVNAQYRIVTSVPLDFEPVLVVPFREGRP